jgi:hypothetical protein
VKLSKAAKARIKRMNQADKKKLLAAAAMLADCEVISAQRYAAVHRGCKAGY